MIISYQNTEADIYSYGQLIYKKSPTVKHHRRKSMNFAALISVIFAVIIYYIDSINTVLIWAAMSVVWLIYVPIQHRRRYLKNMIKTYQQEEHKRFFGNHSITIDENGIADEIENGINQTPWEKIEHIEEVDSHLFIFIESSLAYCIPKEKLTERECEEFINKLKEYRGVNENRSTQ
jgi:hypothetical protein